MAAIVSPARTMWVVPSGEALGSTTSLGDAVADGEAAGEAVGSPLTVADGIGDAAAPEQAVRATAADSRQPARRSPRVRIGLVGVVAEIGGRDRRKGAIVEEACLPTQERQLGAKATGGIGQLEELLLA